MPAHEFSGIGEGAARLASAPAEVAAIVGRRSKAIASPEAENCPGTVGGGA